MVARDQRSVPVQRGQEEPPGARILGDKTGTCITGPQRAAPCPGVLTADTASGSRNNGDCHRRAFRDAGGGQSKMERAGDGLAGVLQAEGASVQRHQGLK